MKFCGRSRLTYLGQSVLAANGTTPQIVFCRHTPLIWCLKFTLARQLPGICLSCVGATRVSVANSFHPSVLTGLCHLSFYQELSVRHWHLGVFYFQLQLREKLNNKERKTLHLHIRRIDSWSSIPCRCQIRAQQEVGQLTLQARVLLTSRNVRFARFVLSTHISFDSPYCILCTWLLNTSFQKFTRLKYTFPLWLHFSGCVEFQSKSVCVFFHVS